MGVQDIIAESKKKMELKTLKQKNENLDALVEKLTEAEEKIRQENIGQNIMPNEVDKVLQNRTIKDYKAEQEEQRKIFRDREIKRKKLEAEEKELEESFSQKVQGSVNENKKMFGYLKRYVLIGLVTGLPGIGLAYMFDKCQENKMVKDLYQAHINTVVYPDNAELQKIYQQKRNEFCKVYDIDKIEKKIKESGLIAQIKNDRDELIKLNKELKVSEQLYYRALDLAIEKHAEMMDEEMEENTKDQEEMDDEFELELKQS